jgi:drug/metabolite transporter (DMT)-like permease
VRRRLDPGTLLLVTPLIWGLTFPATKLALGHLPVSTFTAWSRGLGLLAIVALLPLLRRTSPASDPAIRAVGPSLVLGGLMFVGYLLQTEGQARTTATNTGFIAGLYVVFAPILAALLLRHAVAKRAWLGLAMSVIGLALLSVTSIHSLRLHAGDLLVLAGSVVWAGHIVAVGHFSPRHPPWALAVGQMAVAAALHTAVALSGPGLRPAVAASRAVWPLLVLTGALGSGVGFTIQVLAQRTVTPTRAVVLLAGESLVSAAAAAVWIGERLSAHQWLGAALVVGAMVYSELVARRPAALGLDPAVP